MRNVKIQKLPGVILLTFLSFAGAAAQECSTNNTLVNAVRHVAVGIIAADNNRDLSKVMSFYADDAVLMPPNEQPVKGVTAIRGRYESLFAAYNPKIEGRIDEVCIADQLGFVRGHNGGQLVPLKGEEPRQLDDTYLMLLKRTRGGVWKITHLIWHRSH